MQRMHAPRLAALLTIVSLAACSGGNVATQPLPAQNQMALSAPMRSNAKPMHWYVSVGASSNKGALEALDFYTSKMTIDAGDSVTWTFRAAVHTVSFLAPGQTPYGVPTTPAGGSTEDGTTFTSSGIRPSGSTYTLTFPKAGTYNYYCLLHTPEMVGRVIVKAAGARYPHPQAWYNGYAKADTAADLQAAANAVKLFPYANGGNAIAAGISPGLLFGWPPSQSTVYAFLGADNVMSTTTTVKVGTVVTWVNQSNNEPHTVTFPVAGKPLPKQLAGNPFSPPMGGNTYDGKHVVNSGVFGPGYMGWPTTSYNLRFTAPGTYKYYCLFHYPFGMIGTIVVKP